MIGERKSERKRWRKREKGARKDAWVRKAERTRDRNAEFDR